MTDIAIRVQNLSKRYEIYDTPRDRLKQFVMRTTTIFEMRCFYTKSRGCH